MATKNNEILTVVAAMWDWTHRHDGEGCVDNTCSDGGVDGLLHSSLLKNTSRVVEDLRINKKKCCCFFQPFFSPPITKKMSRHSLRWCQTAAEKAAGPRRWPAVGGRAASAAAAECSPSSPSSSAGSPPSSLACRHSRPRCLSASSALEWGELDWWKIFILWNCT